MLPILTNAAQECLSGQFVFIIFPGLQLDDWRDINVCIVWLGVLACWPECEGGGWQTRVTTSVLFNSISHLFSTEALSRCFTHSHAWEGSTIHLIFFCSVLFSFFFLTFLPCQRGLVKSCDHSIPKWQLTRRGKREKRESLLVTK